jgi:hypothetical protein
MRSKCWIRYLWCMWLGYVIGGLLTNPHPEKTWPTEIAVQVARSEATAYARVCRVGLLVVVVATLCIALFSKVIRKRAVVLNARDGTGSSGSTRGPATP